MLARLLAFFSFTEPDSAECPWCGNAHAAEELCRARRVSRRTFLLSASATAAVALLPASAVELPPLSAYRPVLFTVDSILKAHYQPAIMEMINGSSILFTGSRRGGKTFVSPWERGHG